ncbi:guanosine 5-monophosphate oxidoreductase [Amylolactobacillus amylotrophicus DSM 20534]|uniref:GMP reductase n=3 Tax=Amylolactobacillus TaxID=2767876 RepID=A0A0R1YKR5_9LACO|nr:MULTISPECIES: GMP reductase [Amylolactobacillus]APT18453.1 GMP reductase [Amylolactobacillus amylophilus DSM 20533 = JCM 1125]KRK38240.1 guanosine 5-monophosphate oxidoreductase [Amylolactobacillus amylotrophicus DSM 20534]KRM43118.1 guanosine 5-monophosphate oxidoreductase [Amylolactobacillus amylophilus DSM 20533 = JCM 1125]GED80483.1 GMP reductase [Amylolactobacillus amylophilus]
MQIFDYDDIQLIPNKCIIKIRAQADTSIKFGPRTFKIPVVPANMASIIDEDLAEWLAANDYFYIMHRFQPEKRLDFVRHMQELDLFTSISVGIKEDEYKFIDELVAAHLTPDYITIDVAHGHSDYVIKMIHYIKQNLPGSFVIAGNLATPEAVRELENAGADATKIGVGPGKACITKLKTGFGTGGWQLSALSLCSKVARKPLIADGGIRHHGDIAKSVRFGASMVMIGSLLAGHDENPGNIIRIDGKQYKQYWGSASDMQKGAYRNVEGKQMLVPYMGSIKNKLVEMREDLQSSISYAGGNDLESIRKVNYVVVKNSIMNGDY